jgi:hypothetical protein
MSEKLAAPTKVPGEDQTSYVSPSKTIQDPMSRPVPPVNKPESVDISDSTFINAAFKLVELGVGSYEEAVPILLIAKASKPKTELDLGMLKATSKKSVPVAESIQRNSAMLQSLFENSNEHRLIKIAEALRSVKELLEDKDGWVAPVATFRSHVIAINSKGDIFRAEIDEDEDGIKVVKAEKIAEGKAPTVDIKKTLTDTINALVEGRKSQVKIQLSELLKHASSDSAFEFAKQRYQHILEGIRATPFWKSHVKENEPRIRAFVRGSLNELNKGNFKQRFQKLRLGEVNEPFVSQYKTSVQKALHSLMEKFDKMRSELNETYTRDQWLINSLASYDKKYGAQTTNFLNHFISEFTNSLSTVVNSVRPIISERDIQFQALVYDTLAEDYQNYALAFLFAKKALGDLKSGV